MNLLDLFTKKQPEFKDDDFAMLSTLIDHHQYFKNIFGIYDPTNIMNMVGGMNGLRKIYRQDSDIKGAVEKRFSALDSCTLTLIGDDEKEVEFMWELIIPLQEQIRAQSEKAILYGYSVGQVIYNVERNLISPLTIIYEKPEYFTPIIDGKSTAYSGKNELTTYGKYLLSSVDLDLDMPKGDALLARLYTPWMFRINSFDYWATFIKRFAGGLMVGKVTRQDQVKVMREMMDAAHKAASLAYSGADADVNIITPGSDGNAFKIFEDLIIDKYNRLILGETLTSRNEQGTNAATLTHNEVRKEKVDSDIKVIERTTNNLIEVLHFLNGRTGAMPKAKMLKDKGLELARTDRDVKLGTQIKFSKKYYIDNYGLEEEDFEIREAQAPVFGFIERQAIEEKKELAHAAKLELAVKREDLTPEFQQLEELIDIMLRMDVTSITADDILHAVQTAEDQKDLEDTLSFLLQKDSDDFKELLTQSQLLASSYGVKDAEKKRS